MPADIRAKCTKVPKGLLERLGVPLESRPISRPAVRPNRLESNGKNTDDLPRTLAGGQSSGRRRGNHRARLVYRLVRSNPPTGDDLRSQRAERPHRVFRRVTECQARGVMVRTNLAKEIEMMDLPRMKGRLLF